MIAFTHVFLDTKNNEVIIVLVLQPKGTVTNFFGADTYHGALCAMLLMNYLVSLACSMEPMRMNITT